MRACQKMMCSGFVLVASSLIAFPAKAVQIAAESYVKGNPGYEDTGNLVSDPSGSPPNSYGFSGTYAGDTALVANSLTGLDATQFTGETGGGVAMFMRFSANSGATGPRQSQRALAGGYVVPADRTYWFSGIMRTGNTVPTGQFALMGFSSFESTSSTATPTNPFGLMWGIEGANVVVRARDTAGAWSPTTLASSYAVGTTNAQNLVFVAKMEYQTDANGNLSATEDRLSVWLNPASTTSEASLGTPTVIQTDALSTGTDITRLNYIGQTQFNTGSTDRPVFADEPRFGTTLADVTSAAVPEPSVVGAGVIACAAGLLRRRRHRSP